MSKSLLETVLNGNIIVSDEMHSAFLHSVDDSHAYGGSIYCLSPVLTDPPARPIPHLFTRLDEANKQQICVRFMSGAIQVLATEP